MSNGKMLLWTVVAGITGVVASAVLYADTNYNHHVCSTYLLVACPSKDICQMPFHCSIPEYHKIVTEEVFGTCRFVYNYTCTHYNNTNCWWDEYDDSDCTDKGVLRADVRCYGECGQSIP